MRRRGSIPAKTIAVSRTCVSTYGGYAMTEHDGLTRRSFLTVAAAAPLAAARAGSQIPVGLELYSVRNDLQKDLMGTVKAVAKVCYECVEFYAPYYDWTPDYTKQVRKELDDLGIRCYSTHNSLKSFAPE